MRVWIVSWPLLLLAVLLGTVVVVLIVVVFLAFLVVIGLVSGIGWLTRVARRSPRGARAA